jgi:hypothetical protein
VTLDAAQRAVLEAAKAWRNASGSSLLLTEAKLVAAVDALATVERQRAEHQK